MIAHALKHVSFEVLERRCLFSVADPMSFIEGTVRIQASGAAHQLTIEQYTSYTYAPDSPDHQLIVTGTFHWVHFTLHVDGPDGLPDGYWSGNWQAQDIKEIVVDGANNQTSVTVLGDDSVTLPAKLQLVGDRSNYSVFRMSRPQFNADLFTKFADDIKTLNGNAEDLILAPAATPANSDTQSAPQTDTQDTAQTPTAPTVPPFSTQPLSSSDSKSDDDALWA